MERYIFDLDGTLLNANWDQENEFVMDKLLDGKSFIKNKSKILNDYEDNHYRYDIYLLSNYFKINGLDVSPEFIREWIQYNSEYLEDKIVNGAFEVLEHLKHNNKKLSILTNWFSDTQIRRLERNNMKDYFDTIVCGDQVLKPIKKSFILAANETDLDKCIMIGDNKNKDYYGALDVGLDAFLIKEEKDLIKVKKIGGRL